MIGPWKRAVQLDRLNDVLLTKLRIAQQERATLLAMVDKLQGAVIEMRRDGFNAAPPDFSPPPEEPLDPRIEDAAEDFATPGTSLWRSLITTAKADIEGGLSVEQALEKMRAGGDPGEWELV